MNFEIQLSKGGNTGVFLRGKNPNINKPDNSLVELELIDGPTAGELFPIDKPKQPIQLADGNWHRFSILAKGKSYTVSHNGVELYTADLSNTPFKNLPLQGRIGFQGYLGAVKLRNVAIKEL